MKSAHGVYPIVPNDDTAFAFVEFIHTRGSAIWLAKEGPGAPQVYVSLMEGAKNNNARACSTASIFRPDALAASPGNAKHIFHGFAIRFLKDH
jgi:hypothetical protein